MAFLRPLESAANSQVHIHQHANHVTALQHPLLSSTSFFFSSLLLCVSLSPRLLWLSGVFPRDKTLAHFTHEQSGAGGGCVCVHPLREYLFVAAWVGGWLWVSLRLTLMYALKVREKEQVQTQPQSFCTCCFLPFHFLELCFVQRNFQPRDKEQQFKTLL